MGRKDPEILSISRTVLVPDPLKDAANNSSSSSSKGKRVSIASSVISDTSTENGDAANLNLNRSLQQKPKLRRCRKRLSIFLHTHVALIIVSLLAALDASFVIGQIICDILIMKETLHDWEVTDTNLTALLRKELPDLLNNTEHGEDLNLAKIQDILWKHQQNGGSPSQRAGAGAGFVLPTTGQIDPRLLEALQNALQQPNSQTAGNLNVNDTANATNGKVVIGFFTVPNSRRKRAAGGEDGEHSLLHDLTHSFHLGSMIILSMLLLETLLKVFAMGKKILHHKLEIFDAFVVSVSWALDVAFWEGIWAHPGTEAATILIFILPWRVVRIVNSFVLVIQEKDHVQLKIVKQRLRMSVKKSKESTRKASSYRTEVKHLQGLCRKYGAEETEINACGPTGRNGRRRSSLMPAMERAASLTLISALGSHPSLYTMDSSSDEENPRDGQDRTLRSALSVTTLDSVFTIDGKSPSLGDGYLTSDNELDDESTAEGLDNHGFAGDESRPASSATEAQKDDVESGRAQLAQRLHDRLGEQPSVASVMSETSTTSTVGAQEVPPKYHDAIAKKDSDTRL